MKHSTSFISLKYLQGFFLPLRVDFDKGNHPHVFGETKNLAASLNLELYNYGYTMSEKLFTAMSCIPAASYDVLFRQWIAAAKKTVGADVEYKPFYPNFPAQVMEVSDVELYMNAVCHYWTSGDWRPEYTPALRRIGFEEVKLREIKLLDKHDYFQIFKTLMTSNDSISEMDKEVIADMVAHDFHQLPYVAEVPFKENLCFLAAKMIDSGHDIVNLPVKTATDILRVCTGLSGGDVSLATNTKFKSLKRSLRKQMTKLIEKHASLEDIYRHKSKWIRLFHSLHVGDYSDKVFKMAAVIRGNKKVHTFASKLERAISSGNVSAACDLLQKRPGDFARRLDQVMRHKNADPTVVAMAFCSVADKVSTRVLMQLLGHFKHRHLGMDKRVAFPKGSLQKSILIDGKLPAMSQNITDVVVAGIIDVLTKRFSKLESLGKVYIDPALRDCPLPAQQRSASAGLFNVARGSRLPFGDKPSLRLFAYWKQPKNNRSDLDLSAVFLKEDFSFHADVSYMRLRDSKMESYHSGDIVKAPNGASEFIDINIGAALNGGARYVAMCCLMFTRQNFSDMDTCYAGWMTRSKVKSNEIYDPKTVQQKIDISSESRISVPVVFDLKERKAIWVDLIGFDRSKLRCNNVRQNGASISQVIEAITTLHNKPTLYDLFNFHVSGRGEKVSTREDADTIFSIDEGITPYCIPQINSEFMV